MRIAWAGLILLAVGGKGGAIYAANATSVQVAGSPNPVLLGHAITLTATVTPGSATGTITFYDGTTVLGMAPLNGGAATLTTRQLPFGKRGLRARYSGDGANAASGSPTVTVAVAVPPETGLKAPVSYGTGMNPAWVATGDFNNDGITDVALPNAGDGTVSVLLGQGNGTFGNAQQFTSGSSPYGLAVADLNGDGWQDLVVANSGDNSVSVLLGDGDGTFQAPWTIAVGSAPLAVVVADFNRDGRVDVATADFGDNQVTILLGNGDGTLSWAGATPVGISPAALVAGDFNGDISPDLAAVNTGDPNQSVTILLGNGAGGFSAALPVTGQNGPSGIAAGDFDGDGKLDLAVADYGDYGTLQGSGVLVLLGNGNGTFRSTFTTLDWELPASVAVGDLNGDGVADAVVVTDSGIDVLAGNGDGTFQPPVSYTTGSAPFAAAIGSFTSDALTGVAVADIGASAVDLLLGTPGTCVFTLGPPTTVIDGSAATVALNLAANSPGCPWSATASSWLVPTPASGFGGGVLPVNVQGNGSGAARTGTVTVAGHTVSISQEQTAQIFSDVAPTAYFFDAVDLLKQRGVTSGCSATQYCPMTNITRAQMAVFIVRAVYGGDNFTSSPTPYFADVQPADFGFRWIQKMYELGITAGCSATQYCPNNSVTRDQMAVFIVRARFGATAPFDSSTTPYFTDVPATYWAFGWIQRMKMDGITAGCGTNLYCPGSPVTRADMAVFMMRGAFNQLLPAGTPVITSVAPAAIPRGQTTTVTISGANTNFAEGSTTVGPLPGVTIGAISVISPTAVSVSLTPAPDALAQPVSIVASTGTQEAIGPNQLILQ